MESTSKTTSSADYNAVVAYCGLRDQILNLRSMPAAMGGVIAVLAEIGMEAVATIVAVADGSTSLYLSSGGGTIGAGAHKQVAVCALKLLGAADQAQQMMQSVTAYPLPLPKHVRFYIVSSNGVRSAEVLESELQNQAHVFSPMYRLTHNVITAIRLIKPPAAAAKPNIAGDQQSS
jgi:hypothetical protein